LQEIQKQNIPFFIIINQIDKHDEKEIAFSEFNYRVNQTFDQWGVKPENIFYSSIIDETIQYNELSKLKSFIYSLLNENEDSGERITSATKEVITEHKEFLREQYEDQLLEDDSQGKSDGNTLRSLEEKLT